MDPPAGGVRGPSVAMWAWVKENLADPLGCTCQDLKLARPTGVAREVPKVSVASTSPLTGNSPVAPAALGARGGQKEEESPSDIRQWQQASGLLPPVNPRHPLRPRGASLTSLGGPVPPPPPPQGTLGQASSSSMGAGPAVPAAVVARAAQLLDNTQSGEERDRALVAASMALSAQLKHLRQGGAPWEASLGASSHKANQANPFEGQWRTSGDSLVSVCGKTVVGPDGGSTPITSMTPTTLQIFVDGKEHHATLMGDKLCWSDGDHWRRAEAPAGSQRPPTDSQRSRSSTQRLSEEMVRRDKVYEESIRGLRAQLLQLEAFAAGSIAGAAGGAGLLQGGGGSASRDQTGRSTRRLCLELEARDRQSQAKLAELQGHVARLEANARLMAAAASGELASGAGAAMAGLPQEAAGGARPGPGFAEDRSRTGSPAQGGSPSNYLSSVSSYLSSVHQPNLQGGQCVRPPPGAGVLQLLAEAAETPLAPGTTGGSRP